MPSTLFCHSQAKSAGKQDTLLWCLKTVELAVFLCKTKLPASDTKLTLPTSRLQHHCSRYYTPRSGPLLSGLVGLIEAGSTPPLDVETAAATLRAVLHGRTALAATKTFRCICTATATAGAWDGREGRVGVPAMVIGGSLLAWKEGKGLMQVKDAGSTRVFGALIASSVYDLFNTIGSAHWSDYSQRINPSHSPQAA